MKFTPSPSRSHPHSALSEAPSSVMRSSAIALLHHTHGREFSCQMPRQEKDYIPLLSSFNDVTISILLRFLGELKQD